MPASAGEIAETVRAALDEASPLLSEHIVSSSKRVLLHQIDFVAAEKPYSLEINSLRTKYIPLNPSRKSQINGDGISKNGKMKNPLKADTTDCLPTPKVMLYPEDRVRLEWRRVQKIGSGLVNMGNTCFLNSTLQCLTYTAPLVNYCLSDEHIKSCKQAGFCMVCELQRHIRRCFESNGHSIKPQSILQKLKMIAKHMHWGHQEDAHEFLRYVVDGLQKACLNGCSKLDKYSRETTVVNHIFGGFLRSQVLCLKCGERSNTFDPFMDISLDIKNVQTLEKAFEKFVHPETLESDNAYMCPRCKQKVVAQKRLSLHKTPNVLTIQLKRFDYHRMMGKISRHIQFPDKLNIRPYLSQKQGDAIMYSLYAVLVHSGFHCNSGHYFSFVKSPSQIWYCMNDTMVQQVSATRVFDSEAYVLFYAKTSKTKTDFIGPTMPVNHTFNNQHKFDLVNRSNGKSSTDVGTAVSRKRVLTSISSGTVLPEKRAKVSFGIHTPQTKPASYEPPGDAKPRIVVQIKNGKVTTIEKSPDGQSKVVENKPKLTNGDSKPQKSGLVPYGDDSDSDQDLQTKKVNGNGVVGKDLPVKKLNGNSNAGQDLPMKKLNGISGVGQDLQTKKLNGKSVAGHTNGDIKKKSENGTGNGVVFDSKLNATTSVPGNMSLLETSQNRTKDFTLKLNKSHLNSLKSDVCGTSPNSKPNQISTWHIQDQELEPSPSIGSCSSTASVNSTTEWHVTDGNEGPQYVKLPEATHSGWLISQPGEPAVESNIVTPGETKNISASKEQKTVKANLEEKEVSKNLGENLDLKINNKTVQNDIVQNCTLSHDHRYSQNTDICKNTDISINKTGVSTVELPSPSESAAVVNGNHIDISDTLPLLSEAISPTEDYLRKKCKKHKKHKKSEDRHKYKDLVNESSDADHSSRKHKKKKKHKHKEKEREEAVHHKKKHKHKADGDGDKKHKDDSSLDYVWVEKTKDTIVNGSEAVCNGKEVTEQAWDYHSAPGSLEKMTKSTWDGTKSSRIAAELEKNSSSKGYGSSVPSWDGGKSHLDVEVEKEAQRYKKRHWEDDYDEELDAGKVKKVKKHCSDTNINHNPFQRVQDDRRAGKSWSASDHINGDHHSSSHQNGHSSNSHSSHWKRRDHNGYNHRRSGHSHRDRYSH